MKTQEQNLEFDFKKINKNQCVDSNADSSLQTTMLANITTPFLTTMFYLFLSGVIFKLYSIDLLPIAFILSKAVLTLSAISQSLSYSKMKKVKEQLLNAGLNVGILLYLFKYDGFETLFKLCNSFINMY